MSIQDIQERIDNIKASVGDDEAAHGMEAALRRDFIAYLANGGTKDIRSKAALVLTTAELNFARWCA
jgi:hypothetical protein